jgi:hypothetical protein
VEQLANRSHRHGFLGERETRAYITNAQPNRADKSLPLPLVSVSGTHFPHAMTFGDVPIVVSIRSNDFANSFFSFGKSFPNRRVFSTPPTTATRAALVSWASFPRSRLARTSRRRSRC